MVRRPTLSADVAASLLKNYQARIPLHKYVYYEFIFQGQKRATTMMIHFKEHNHSHLFQLQGLPIFLSTTYCYTVVKRNLFSRDIIKNSSDDTLNNQSQSWFGFMMYPFKINAHSFLIKKRQIRKNNVMFRKKFQSFFFSLLIMKNANYLFLNLFINQYLVINANYTIVFICL